MNWEQVEETFNRGCDAWAWFFDKLARYTKNIVPFLATFALSPILITIYITGLISGWRENRRNGVETVK